MKYKNRLKRVADALEKLSVAGMAIWLFRENTSWLSFGGAFALLIVSLILTKEDI